MVDTNATGTQTDSFSNSGNWSFLGTNFDVTATGIGQIDAPSLNIGISLATTMNFGNVGLSITMTALLYNIVSPGLRFSSLLSGPPAGKFAVLADGSGNVSLSNTPSGSGTSWDVGGNTGLADPSIFGTLDAAGISFIVNTSSFMDVSATKNVTFAFDDVTFNAGGVAVLFGSGTTSLQIGYTGMPVQYYGSTMNLSSNANMTITTAADMFLQVPIGAFDLGVAGAITLGSGLSIGLSGPNITINSTALTNTTTIGNVLAGNVV